MRRKRNKPKTQVNSTAQEYLALVQSYLNYDLSIEEFKRLFFAKFLAEPEGMNPELFNILNDLFLDADACSLLWQEADESPFRITEKTFHIEAASTLDLLVKYVSHSE